MQHALVKDVAGMQPTCMAEMSADFVIIDQLGSSAAARWCLTGYLTVCIERNSRIAFTGELVHQEVVFTVDKMQVSLIATCFHELALLKHQTAHLGGTGSSRAGFA